MDTSKLTTPASRIRRSDVLALRIAFSFCRICGQYGDCLPDCDFLTDPVGALERGPLEGRHV